MWPISEHVRYIFTAVRCLKMGGTCELTLWDARPHCEPGSLTFSHVRVQAPYILVHPESISGSKGLTCFLALHGLHPEYVDHRGLLGTYRGACLKGVPDGRGEWTHPD
jgi:hypothetical protein